MRCARQPRPFARRFPAITNRLTNLVLSRAQVQELVERMLKSSGRRIDLSQPFVDAVLPDGHRLHIVLEEISRGFSAVNIRKFTVRAHRLQSLVELGSLSPRAAAFLEAAVRAGLNILVAGGTQAGNTPCALRHRLLTSGVRQLQPRLVVDGTPLRMVAG